MYPLAIFLMFMAIIGSMGTLFATSRPPVPGAQGTPEALTDNFLVYADAVRRFAGVQPQPYTAPAAGNAVPDASLSFPTWHVRNTRWQNKVIGGVVTIYADAPIPEADLSRELAQRTGGSFSAGNTDATGQIVSYLHGPTGVMVPAGIPAGVAVYQVNLQ